jgi:hypothetical protein
VAGCITVNTHAIQMGAKARSTAGSVMALIR